MVRSCSAYGCTNRYIKGGTIQFHGFPLKNETLNKLWIRKVKRKNFVPTAHSTICSAHFRDDDYLDRPGRSFKALKPDAVPSGFSQFPEYYQPKEKKPRSLTAKLEKCRMNTEAIAATSKDTSQVVTECPSSDILLMEKSPKLSTLSTSSSVHEFCESTAEDSSLVQDSSTQTEQSPNEEIVQLKKKNTFLVRKVKILQQKIRRRDENIANLQDLLRDLKDKVFIEAETGKVLTSHFGGYS